MTNETFACVVFLYRVACALMPAQVVCNTAPAHNRKTAVLDQPSTGTLTLHLSMTRKAKTRL